MIMMKNKMLYVEAIIVDEERMQLKPEYQAEYIVNKLVDNICEKQVDYAKFTETDIDFQYRRDILKSETIIYAYIKDLNGSYRQELFNECLELTI